MATPVILVTGHEGTAAVTADLLGLLTDHGTATLRSVAPGSVRRADPRPRCHRREQRRRHRASMKSAIHPDHHPRRLPRCPVLRRDQVVLEMIVITMVGRPSGPGERKWDVGGQRGTRGHRRACTRQIHPHRRPCRPAFVPGQPRGRRRDRRRGAGDLQRRRVRPVGRPGVGRPSWCPGGRCLLAARRRGRRRRAQRTRLLRPQCRQGGRGNDRRPVGGPRPVQFRELSSERRRVQPRRRRNRNFRTRDRHHLSRRRGHRDRTRRALPAGGSRPEKSNPGYLHRGQRKRQRPHPGRYGGRARHDRRP